MLGKFKLGWPAVVLVSVALLSLSLVLTFAPDDTRTVVVEWMGWAFLAVSQFVGPVLRTQKKEEETSDE